MCGLKFRGARRWALTLAMGWLGANLAYAQYDIGEALTSPDFWHQDPVLFVKAHQAEGFNFTSDTREGADTRLDGAVQFNGLDAYETRVTFAPEGGIQRVEVLLFGRGGTERTRVVEGTNGKQIRMLEHTERTMTREEFMTTLTKVRTQFTAKGAKPPKEVSERAKKGTIQKVQQWKDGKTLAWSYNQEGAKVETFEPGYIRLTVVPMNKQGAVVKSAKGAQSIAENVLRDVRGDVFIDNIPMVDQGQKGYCSAATSERVLRYYGLNVDEHDIAEAAGTQAQGGTSTWALKEAVEAVGKRYQLGTVVTYGDFEKPTGERIKGLTKEVANYNKAAKKLKKPAIEESEYVEHKGNMTMYYPAKVDAAMDAEVLREMKVNGAQKAKFTKFMKDIHQQVDKGIPLFWGVKLGIYPEPGLPQTGGGHMRLIIGYNDKKKEILYTDSWGAGHELKRMPCDWAWTISHCLLYLKPLTK